jgi:hypothetical protein
VKFMMMHKTNDYYEAGGLPSTELIRNVGRMVGEMVQRGKLSAADGLRSSAEGVRLKFAGGERTVLPGPFVGSNELIASFAVLRVRSLDEAVEWASRIAAIDGDGEVDIRPATEPWDIGLGKKPAEVTTRRYIAMRKASPGFEAGARPAPAQAKSMDGLIREMTQAGVLLSVGSLAPSSGAARLRNFGGKKTFVDGPFVESKELIGGFVVLELGSREEAIDWAGRYADVLGEIELDIRPVESISTFGR